MDAAEAVKEDSLGSDTPRTVTDSHATGSDVNKEDDRVSSKSEEGQSPRWDSTTEEEDSSFFPSARVDRSDTPELGIESNKDDDDDDGPAKSVKHRKRVLTTQSSESRRRKLDPEALARHQQKIERRARVQNIIQQAMFDASTGQEREYSLAPVEVKEEKFSLECIPGSKLSNESLEDLLSLTRDNMKAMYDAIGNEQWAWSDTRKRGELRNERMRFILLKKLEQEDVPENIVGFVAFRFTPESMIPHVYVHEVQVVGTMQGLGLGHILMDAIERIASEASMQLLMLTVFTRNAPAVRFYERLGFQVDEASPGPCYNLLGEDGTDLDKRSPYEIMSKVLDEAVLEYACSECDGKYRCRFEDTLIQHAGLVHGHPFPFNCAVEGCLKGTVHLHQLHRHNEIKHGIKPPVLGVTTRRGALAAAQAATALKSEADEGDDGGDQQNYLHARVLLKAEGRKGTVLRMDKGFYTVRLDGPKLETVVCRATNFEGHKYIPPKKKVVDPDHEFALKLQYEDGWARKSSRVRGKPLSS